MHTQTQSTTISNLNYNKEARPHIYDPRSPNQSPRMTKYTPKKMHFFSHL